MDKVALPDSGQDDYGRISFRVLKALRRIIRAVDIHSRKLNDEFDITVPQMVCLYSLSEKESQTQTELAKQVNLGTSTINGIIDRLDKKGLVKKERDLKDRRRVYLTLTDSGRELVESAPSLLQDKFAESLRNLPGSEQIAIAHSLERVVELMEAEHLDASPNLIANAILNNDK